MASRLFQIFQNLNFFQSFPNILKSKDFVNIISTCFDSSLPRESVLKPTSESELRPTFGSEVRQTPL